MTYEVGTKIDLRYLNKKIEVQPVRAARVEKKTNFQEAVSRGYDVGTSFVFKFTKEGLQASRRIPVVCS